MKKQDVKIGGIYQAKVSDKKTRVQIKSESRHGGWDAVNMATNKSVRIKGPQRLSLCPESPATRKEKKAAAATKEAATCPTCKNDTLARNARGQMFCPICKTRMPGGEATPPAKPATPAKKAGARADGTMSGLDAAAKILAEEGKPLSCKVIATLARAQAYWMPAGKTPEATLYSAIIREISRKGKDSRFVKTERGRFALAS